MIILSITKRDHTLDMTLPAVSQKKSNGLKVSVPPRQVCDVTLWISLMDKFSMWNLMWINALIFLKKYLNL